jgi:hypothetical protein
MDQLILLNPILGSVVVLLVGTLICFYGKRLFILVLAVAGFLLGYVYGGPLAAEITDSPDLIRWAPLVLGVILAALSGAFLRLSLFLAGLVIGWFLSVSFAPEAHFLVWLVCALLAGSMLALFKNVVLSLLTAIVGGRMIALGAVSLLACLSVRTCGTVYGLIFAASALIGAAFQLRRKGKKGS